MQIIICDLHPGLKFSDIAFCLLHKSQDEFLATKENYHKASFDYKITDSVMILQMLGWLQHSSITQLVVLMGQGMSIMGHGIGYTR